jgi:hypothetical protein
MRTCTSNQPYGNSCPDPSRVLVLNDPGNWYGKAGGHPFQVQDHTALLLNMMYSGLCSTIHTYGRGVIENNDSTDVEPSPPPRRVS